jgi:hypothetical protein
VDRVDGVDTVTTDSENLSTPHWLSGWTGVDRILIYAHEERKNKKEKLTHDIEKSQFQRFTMNKNLK